MMAMMLLIVAANCFLNLLLNVSHSSESVVPNLYFLFHCYLLAEKVTVTHLKSMYWYRLLQVHALKKIFFSNHTVHVNRQQVTFDH